MAILDRFGDIIKANINVLLDKMEDPAKMIDQYMNNMMEDLAEVKRSTAGVMAEETRTKRMVDENQAEIDKYAALAKKALSANNEGDARVFIAKKQELESLAVGLQTAYDAARLNAEKMRQMHDKLVTDIETLKSRREMIKAKVAVAKTQEKMNELSSATERTQGTIQAFERMEDKADRMLDKANAMADLNEGPVDDAKALEEKYASSSSASVDEELNRMKKELGQ
ncbi:PspA/IM30 family protein [Dehalobacterium formicoaceticum]|uniref:PspA/IM30 family protein n=1 Tax=Dehalobacterium formicoaceticum TaxID=51515 RepID=A0ABT1Y265_9FIRM|nr:PspA/IM30 family protein [Dehalobacterium formicoaceticum]MCR6544970.1 PspA/IM30 family protein [Dehalobacterium formicoaceticum]